MAENRFGMTHIPDSPKKAPSTPKKATTAQSSSTRTEAVNGLFQLASFGSVMVGNYADAATLSQHGPGISQEVAALGAQNEQIGRWIDYLTQAGPYAGLLTAVLPLGLQLLANHGRIDHSRVPGLTDPKVLEVQIQSEMKAAAVTQLQQAQQEQAKYDAALAEMEATMQPSNGAPAAQEKKATK